MTGAALRTTVPEVVTELYLIFQQEQRNIQWMIILFNNCVVKTAHQLGECLSIKGPNDHEGLHGNLYHLQGC